MGKLENAIEANWEQDAEPMDWSAICAMLLGLCQNVGFHEASAMLKHLSDEVETGRFGSTGKEE